MSWGSFIAGVVFAVGLLFTIALLFAIGIWRSLRADL